MVRRSYGGTEAARLRSDCGAHSGHVEQDTEQWFTRRADCRGGTFRGKSVDGDVALQQGQCAWGYARVVDARHHQCSRELCDFRERGAFEAMTAANQPGF